VCVSAMGCRWNAVVGMGYVCEMVVVVCAAASETGQFVYVQATTVVATGMNGVALGCNLQRLRVLSTGTQLASLQDKWAV
jgi:hypothetical protein